MFSKRKATFCTYWPNDCGEGRGHPEDKIEIAQLIAKLKHPDSWDVVENQVYLIDDIAFAAATIGDWQTAFEEAKRNVEKF